jgi:hypothetical protein
MGPNVCKVLVQSLVEGMAIMKECRGIRKMEIMYKVGIVKYSVSGECGGTKDIEGKGRGRRGWKGGGLNRRRNWGERRESGARQG